MVTEVDGEGARDSERVTEDVRDSERVTEGLGETLLVGLMDMPGERLRVALPDLLAERVALTDLLAERVADVEREGLRDSEREEDTEGVAETEAIVLPERLSEGEREGLVLPVAVVDTLGGRKTMAISAALNARDQMRRSSYAPENGWFPNAAKPPRMSAELLLVEYVREILPMFCEST